jgi:hypothetical protein
MMCDSIFYSILFSVSSILEREEVGIVWACGSRGRYVGLVKCVIQMIFLGH